MKPSTARLAPVVLAVAALAMSCAPMEAVAPSTDDAVPAARAPEAPPPLTLEPADGLRLDPIDESMDHEALELEEPTVEDSAFEGRGAVPGGRVLRRSSGGGRGGGGRGGSRTRTRSGPQTPGGEGGGSDIGGGSAGFGGRTLDDDGGESIGGKKAEDAPPKRTWKRAQVVPNATRLTIGDSKELPLEGLQVQVRVDGFRARVVLDCLYRSNQPKQLEGRFQLRLPDEASPYYFAFGETVKQTGAEAAFLPEGVTASVGTSLTEIRSRRRDTWSEPKEARMVPRRKAVHAYAETTRRRIDPALMEWSGAGVFAARVFPLLPQKLHRIVVGYDVNLTPVGDGLEYRLDLPEGLPALTLDLDVASVPGATHELETTGFTRSEREGLTHYRTTNRDTRTVKLRLDKAVGTVIAGSDPGTGEHFAASFRPDVPAAKQAGRTRAVFLLDVSASSNPERFGVWVKLLDQILARNEKDLREFAVLCFNVESFWWREQFAANTAANRKAVGDFARGLALEGATDLAAALRRAAHPIASGTYDTFLLSDGATSWGERDAQRLASSFVGPATGALFAYKTGFAGTDRRILDILTRRTGGAVFSVVGESEIATASVAHRARPWSLKKVQVQGGKDLLLAGRPRALFPGQTLYLAGRGTPAANASVVLTLAQDGVEKELRVPLGQAIPSELAPRVYGQIATTQLEEFTFQTEDVAKAYAQHFRVVGNTCSLLMLDTKEDYERFDIRPEDDARVVREKPARTEVLRAIEEWKKSVHDPRVAFLVRLDRLEKSPGVTFADLAPLRELVADMPRGSFVVDVPAVSCEARTWDDVPGDVQELLASRKLDYPAIAAEAERRRVKYGAADALRALSSLVEQKPGDVALLRDVAFTAMEWKLDGQAYGLLHRSADARPYEPETYRMLAETLDAMGKTDLAVLYYELCLAGTWAGRFGEFKRIAGMDYVRFLRRSTVVAKSSPIAPFKERRLREVSAEFAPKRGDLVVTVTWNTDRTDVDLWVTDPSGEVCKYDHPKTKAGGAITKDVTQGYGPEMFLIPEAPDGRYVIGVRYFRSDDLRTGLRTRVFATIVTDWGTPKERSLRKAVTLTKGKEHHALGALTLE